MRNRKTVIVLMLVMLLLSCNSRGVTGVAISGTWTTSNGGIQFRLTDDSGAIGGALFFQSSGAYKYAGPVFGSRFGSSFTIVCTFTDGSGSAEYDGNISSGRLQGNFYLYNSSGQYIGGSNGLQFVYAERVNQTLAPIQLASGKSLLENLSQLLR
jgi:hypothetical protein